MGLVDKTPEFNIDMEEFETSETNHAKTFNKRLVKLARTLSWVGENIFTKSRVLKTRDIHEEGYVMDGKTLTEYLKDILADWDVAFANGLKEKVDKVKDKGLSANDFTDELKQKLDNIAESANKYIHPRHANHASGLYKVTVDEEGHVISAVPVTKEDITDLGIPGQDTNTTYGIVSTEAAGLAPKRTGTITKFLRDDGTWAVPPDTDTTYGIVSTEAAGLAPKRTGTITKFLRDDGTWAVPPDTDTTYEVVSTKNPGLAPKLGGTVTKFLRDDGTWAIPPDTTYEIVSKTTSGLVPKLGGTVTKFLRDDGTWAIPPDTTYETGTATEAGITKLYTGLGENTDGSMTQKAIQAAVNTVKNLITGLQNKIVKSINITEEGYIMDGKTASEAFAELNSKTYYENEKTVSIPSKTSTRIYSHTLSGGIYLVRCNVAFGINTATLTTLNIKNITEERRSLTVRGTMDSGGGLYLEATIDARERDITVDTSVYQGHSSAVQAYCDYSYIKL